MSSPIFDHAVLLDVGDASTRLFPGLTPVFLGNSATGPKLDGSKWLADGQPSPTDAITTELRKEGFSHLIVAIKVRAPARLRVSDGAVGSGYLEGLGFYIDREYEVTDLDRNITSMGFIAPYAYIRLVLIDVQTQKVIAQQRIQVSRVKPTAKSQDGFDPWDSLGAEEKVVLMKVLLNTGISDAIPLLFRPK